MHYMTDNFLVYCCITYHTCYERILSHTMKRERKGGRTDIQNLLEKNIYYSIYETAYRTRPNYNDINTGSCCRYKAEGTLV